VSRYGIWDIQESLTILLTRQYHKQFAEQEHPVRGAVKDSTRTSKPNGEHRWPATAVPIDSDVHTTSSLEQKKISIN